MSDAVRTLQHSDSRNEEIGRNEPGTRARNEARNGARNDLESRNAEVSEGWHSFCAVSERIRDSTSRTPATRTPLRKFIDNRVDKIHILMNLEPRDDDPP